MQGSATVSEITPQIKFLKVFIAKVSAEIRFSGLESTLSAIKASMKRCFECYLNDYSPVLATYLDPRYKPFLFQNESSEDSKMQEGNLEKAMTDSIKKRVKLFRRKKVDIQVL